jgi:predicted GNAT family acetyltransferase
MHLEFTEDPDHFLTEAAAHLAADPVVTTVISTVTARLATHPMTDAPHCWWAIVREGEDVVGVAMRTAPFVPYPAYVLPMPDEAARALARLLHERGEELGGVNGALPAAQLVAEETARLAGRSVRVGEHTRLFELGELVVPPAPAGRLRLAETVDAELCLAWFRAFATDAAEQAGRTGKHAMVDFTLEDIRVRIDEGLLWLWEDEDGTPVHLTGANLPANGVTRIGPVYTPREHRGRGYASRAVAGVSAGYLADGVRCCLFTDQANPVSNRIYEALGYRAVVDMANLVIG